MKVNVDQTVEISDEDRKLIAEKIGSKHATREDLKAFLWQHGRDWRQALTPRVDDGFQVDATNVNGVGDDEDLLGLEEDEDLI